MRPLVSILLPCYNAEKHLAYALESILSQDYNNLQIICINDGSTDSTLTILKDYSTADTRIEILNLEENKGLITALNSGIELVRGTYFARMDADDSCPADRIAVQVDYLEQHPEFDLVSGGYHYFINNDKPLEYVPPVATRAAALKVISLLSTPLNHAAVLGKSSLLKKSYFYDKHFPHSEDYELFSRLALGGMPMANLERSLYWVRLNPESVSIVHNETQIDSHLRTTARNIALLYADQITFSNSILKLISNRINLAVTIKEVQDALRLLDHYFNRANSNVSFTDGDRKQIRQYYHLHKVNILIQSNKTNFKIYGAKNISFFLNTLFFLKWSYAGIIGGKFILYIKYRLF
jgi:glycosyltransferase involved in cell wall biosynthesis